MQKVSRLINQFIPTNYNLELTLEREARKVSGIVTIQGELAPHSNTISFHAKDLSIESVTVDGAAAPFSEGENEEFTVTPAKVSPGEHTVVITYNGEITDGMHGIYPCYYDENGVKKELLATQFESHHAREAFPCIDEPEAKATFDVTLITEADISVLGNMPVASQRQENDRLVTTFDTTPRMSTYLLAFATGDLQYKTAKTNDGVQVGIWATKAQPADSLDFALDASVKILEYYNDYFGVSYPLPKCDHIALPDFTSGAMENWGLITYREITLLADPRYAGISAKQHIALVIAHESAHMWFGDLVTMKWWNNLWLNESFATLMEYMCLDALYPEWNMWLEFASSEPIYALRRDSTDGVQAVQVDVAHPDEISTLFDGAIVYAKGARLLQMLQNYVGHDAFQAGLTQYFKDFAYKNTEGDDLWKAIAKASGKDIVNIMNTWISQPGYPVVHMSRSGDTVTLTQEQFFVGPHEASDRLWPIPLNAGRDAAPELMTEKTITFTCPEPIRLNVGNTAHFITHYDKATLQAIIDAFADLDPIDRLPLLDEAVLLARGGVMPSAQLIPLIRAYEHETNEQVWGIVAMAMAELRKFVDDDEAAEKKLRTLSASIAHEQYQRLGWEPKPGEPEDDTKLRGTILAMTLYGEDPDAIKTAEQYYTSKKLEELDPETRSLILSSVARYGDSTIVSELMEVYKSTTSSELQIDICAGVTSTRVPEAITMLLDTIKNSDIIRPQDAFRWFAYLIRGRESRDISWQWIRDNWSWVEETFSGDKSYDDYVRYAANGLVTKKQLEEFKEFFMPKRDKVVLTRAIDLGITEIEGRVELIERDKDDVRQALLDL